MKVAFCTLGCKVNQYDTDAMREMFINAGHTVVDFDDIADVYVINTCTVTSTGDKKSRQMASRAHSLCPDAKLIITGCYAQTAPEEALSLPGVSLVLGTSERSRIVELAEKLIAENAGDKTSAVTPHGPKDEFENLSVSREGRTRAYLKIEDGCDRYCAYCIIPYARGPVRSRSLEDVRHQLELLDNEGYREVVLTGIHLMSYGKDKRGAITLSDAIKQAEGLKNIFRIRLGSLEPQLLSDEFIKTVSESGLVCRQFHLSLQSGSDSVLQRMNRRYSPALYADCVARLRQAMPLCAITTDVIVGFPGETEEEFEESMAFVQKQKLSKIHVFPYSRRKGTPAYSMPNQLSSAEKHERAKRLIAVSRQLEGEFISSLVDTKQDVLFEEEKNGLIWGHTDTYVKVGVKPNGAKLINTIVSVTISGYNRFGATGIIKQI